MSLAFTFDDIKQFLQLNGGKIEYHELVKHFKYALSDPYTQGKCHFDKTWISNYIFNFESISFQPKPGLCLKITSTRWQQYQLNRYSVQDH